jgi:hypothetical protein
MLELELKRKSKTQWNYSHGEAINVTYAEGLYYLSMRMRSSGHMQHIGASQEATISKYMVK